ncbi:MAG: hypothetical protein KDD61_18070 [Bdellovibrionales bacterium]|nr:hypothetical protein [Bdellovibrionales bacterium]
MRINYHEDPSKNIQLQPKLAKELVDLGFTFAYKDDILEDHRLESDLFRPNDYLKDGQRYFRIILTGDPLESANMMDIEPSCKIRIEYRVIRKVVAPLGSQTPELYEEVIPMNSLWKEDFADQVPYSCSNEVFLSRVAEGIENFNKEIIGSIRRTIQKQTYDKKINTK